MLTIERPDLEPIEKLSRDTREAAKLLSRAEVRYLVDGYYMMQENRKRLANQTRALVEQQEPHNLIPWLAVQSELLEKEIKKALAVWADAQRAGEWAQSIVGIGPVITAGLLDHINIEKAPTAGHIWRYAGLDPTVKWEKGQKRPWNASLKTLCWKIGESFVKFSNHKNDIYGQIWLARKEKIIRQNEALAFRE